MAIFPPGNARKDTPSFANDPAPPVRDNLPPAPPPAAAEFRPTQSAPPRSTPDTKESLIASNLTIEGRIEGTGHVRIAGRFKGDVDVQGDVTLERGARLDGGVRAEKVIVAGELEGNIESAQRVELLESAVMSGDLKAGTLIVAAGSKIRGHVECGWDNAAPAKPARAERAERTGPEPATP